MIYIAEMQSGTVARVIVAPDDHELAGDQILIGPENIVGIGWTYEGGQFVPPPIEDLPEE